jgi:hypothetical protein
MKFRVKLFKLIFFSFSLRTKWLIVGWKQRFGFYLTILQVQLLELVLKMLKHNSDYLSFTLRLKGIQDSFKKMVSLLRDWAHD